MKLDATIVKTDKRLGIAVGWAVVSTVNGARYFDRQGDWISDEVAAEAFAKFAEGDRVMKLDHSGSARGKVLWIFPLDRSTQDALGLVSNQTGVIIGVKPDDPAILDRFGEDLHGFSIGGRGQIEEEPE